jgi:hypothetical protein
VRGAAAFGTAVVTHCAVDAGSAARRGVRATGLGAMGLGKGQGKEKQGKEKETEKGFGCYYEAELLSDGLMQVGWIDTTR